MSCQGNRRKLRDLVTNLSVQNVRCKSDFEFLLLRSAYYDIPRMNLHGYTICDVHYEYLTRKFRRDYCSLCKIIFGSRTSSKHDLRRVSRPIAFGVWCDYGLSIFDQTMCGCCRKNLEKNISNKKLLRIVKIFFHGYTMIIQFIHHLLFRLRHIPCINSVKITIYNSIRNII